MHRNVRSWVLILTVLLSLLIGAPKTALAAGDAKYIYDAAVLPDGNIAVLYASAGMVNYGVLSPANGWSKQQIVGGKDAAFALDAAGRPHIAYITTGDDLGYTYFDGVSWSVPDVIDSLNVGGVGILTCPDIALDSTGNAHISYLDSRGGHEEGNDYYTEPDLMYATNSSGAFVVSVRSYGQGWFYSPDAARSVPMAPPKIALADAGYRIGIKQYSLSKSMSGQTHTYHYVIFAAPATPPVDLSLEISSSSINQDTFTLYEVDSDGTNVFSLFRRGSNLYVTNGVSEVPGASKVSAASAADMFVDGGGAIYYAAATADSLILYQDGNFKESLPLPASISTTHARVATVVSGGNQIVLYTDTAGGLWACRVSADIGSSDLSSFAIPDRLPVTIAGVAVTDKAYDGTAVSYAGVPSAVVTDTGAPAAVSEYAYTWFDDSTAGTPLLGAPKNAGSYKLVVAVSESDDTFTGSVEIPFTISPKPITITGVTGVDRAYDATNNVDITGGTLVGVVEGDAVAPAVPATGTVAGAGSSDGKAVSLAEVTLGGADAVNYTLAQPSVTVNIAKAPLSISEVQADTRVYDGTTQVTISSVTFGGLQGGESLTANVDYTVAASHVDPGVGSGKMFAGTISLLSTATTGNYSLADGSFATSADITKASGLAPTILPTVQMIKGKVAEYAFDLRSIALNHLDTGPVTYTLGTLTGDSLFSSVPSLQSDGRTLRFTAAGLSEGTATQTLTVSTQNYEDATASVIFTLVDKTPVTISGVAVAGKTYDGTAVSYTGVPLAAVTSTGDEVAISEYTYTWYDATAGEARSHAPKDAGSYKLVISVSEDNDTYTGSLEVLFTISKKPLTVKPKDYSIYVGASLPTPEVEFVGLLTGESGGDVVTFSEELQMEIMKSGGGRLADSRVSGAYTIAFTNSPAFTSANYSVTTENGTLTVVSPHVPSGGSPTTSMTIETSGTTTTARPRATVTAGQASATISSSDANAMVAAARRGRVSDVVLTPAVRGNVARTSVTLPTSALAGLVEAGIDLTVHTPIAIIRLSEDAMSRIAEAAGSSLTVDARRNADGSLSLTLSVDGMALANVGDMNVRLPSQTTAAGAVAVLVREDGTREVLRKSALTGEGMAVLLSGSGTIATVDNARQFADLAPTHWAHRYVAFASSRELFSGTGQDRFSPDAPVTRGMLVTLLHRLESEVGVGSSAAFRDVPEDAWYAHGVAWAFERGIAQGLGNGTFAPELSTTREQLAVMMFNYAKALGLDTSCRGDLAGFADGNQVSDWAQDAMGYAIGAGLIGGKGEGILDPKSGATRAEVAAILQRLITSIATQGM